MKKALSPFVLLFFFFGLQAQFPEKDAIYLGTGLHVGNFTGLTANLNYVFHEKTSLQLGYYGFVRNAKSKPDDFSGGLESLFTLGLSNIHMDAMQNYQLLVGQLLPAKKSETTRFNLAAGIGYTQMRKPINWQPVENEFLSANYTHDTKRTNTISLIINPRIEFPYLWYVGFMVSPMLQINNQWTYAGIGVEMMLGSLRPRIQREFYDD